MLLVARVSIPIFHQALVKLWQTRSSETFVNPVGEKPEVQTASLMGEAGCIFIYIGNSGLLYFNQFRSFVFDWNICVTLDLVDGNSGIPNINLSLICCVDLAVT